MSRSGVAIGGAWGGRVPPLTAKKLPKIGEKRGKSGKIGRKEKKKSGRKGKNREGPFTLPLLRDRTGYATDVTWHYLFALFNDNCHLPCSLVPLTMHFWSHAFYTSITIAQLPFLGTKIRSSMRVMPNRSCKCVKQIHITRALYASHAWWVHNFPRLQRSKFWLNVVSFVLLKKIYLAVI